LSEDFDLETYQQANDKNIILLFAIDPKERLRAFTNEYEPEVQAGWTLLTLVPSAGKTGYSANTVSGDGVLFSDS
jgi:hypothetical protein